MDMFATWRDRYPILIPQIRTEPLNPIGLLNPALPGGSGGKAQSGGGAGGGPLANVGMLLLFATALG